MTFSCPVTWARAKDFRERYELPITREKDAAGPGAAGAAPAAFPAAAAQEGGGAGFAGQARTGLVLRTDAGPASVYQQVIEASRKEVLEAVGAQGVAKSRMVVLSALLRLRQVCCDLRLLKLEGVNPANASGKLDLFGELLEEAIDGGHRVAGVQPVRQHADAPEGEARPRRALSIVISTARPPTAAAVVERFQTNSAIPVFLISLKAGGVGLNLTGADTVIHFDPWWNPAVEDQATDRAHRIGQTRVVTSYKLITRDTVEEKILTLQNRKREVIQATIGGEEEFAASLSWEEIQELLA